MTYDLELGEETDCTVLELLDRVLNAGVVLAGDITITVADIELIYLRLELLLASAETARQAGWLPPRHERKQFAHAQPDYALCGR
jgi:hypothetical protein